MSKIDVQLNIEMLAVDKIIPYDNNPRSNDAAVDEVIKSVSEYGFKQPIVIDKNNVVIVGHTRLLAAQKLGLTEVPVHVADNLNEKQAKAYRIADNKTNDFSVWNNERLKFEFEDIEGLYTGFSEIEILNMCEKFDGDFDPNAEWDGMPEFNQVDNDFYRSLKVNFENEEGLQKFLEVVKVEITDKTQSFIYPIQKRGVRKDTAYQDSE